MRKSSSGNHTSIPSIYSRRKSDYKKLKDGRISPMQGIPRSLKPRCNLYTGQIEITTPDGKKEYYKEEYKGFTTRYSKVENEKKGWSRRLEEKSKTTSSSYLNRYPYSGRGAGAKKDSHNPTNASRGYMRQKVLTNKSESIDKNRSNSVAFEGLILVLILLAIGIFGCSISTTTNTENNNNTYSNKPTYNSSGDNEYNSYYKPTKRLCSRSGCTNTALSGETLCMDHWEIEQYFNKKRPCLKVGCNNDRVEGEFYCSIHLPEETPDATTSIEQTESHQIPWESPAGTLPNNTYNSSVEEYDEDDEEIDWVEYYYELQEIYGPIDFDSIQEYEYW